METGTKKTILIKENFIEIIKPELNRRVDLIASMIVSCFLTGNNPNETSFRHVINRIMVLLQMPATFILFHRNEVGQYIGQHKFNNHYRDQDRIIGCVKKASKSDLFQLFDTPYYVCVLINTKIKSMNDFHILKNEETPTTTDDLAAYLLRQLFKANTFEHYGKEFIGYMNACIENCAAHNEDIKKWVLGESAEKVQIKTLLSKKSLQKELKTDLDKKVNLMLCENKDFSLIPHLQGNGYLDRVYKKINKNLEMIGTLSNALSQAQSSIVTKVKPSNYVIFTRGYASESSIKRHSVQDEGCFDYDIKIALCDSQKNEIRDYFIALSKGIDDKKVSKTAYHDSLDKKYIDDNNNYAVLAKDLDQYFWGELAAYSELKKKDEDAALKRINDMLKILGDNFGQQTRSAADLIFDSGITHFRRPFADGGLSRCFPNKNVNLPKTLKEAEKENPYGDIVDDLKRLVISSYWYRGMVSLESSIENEMGMMLVPIEVGNRIWCVVGYFTALYKVSNDSNKFLNLSVNSATWNINYHIYQDVHMRLKKDLRHSINDCHRDLHAHYYNLLAHDNIMKRNFDKNKYDAAQRKANFLAWINDRFFAISAYFAYDVVELELREGQASPSGKAASLEDSQAFTENGFMLVSDNTKSVKNGIFLTQTRHCVIKPLSGNNYFPEVPCAVNKHANKVATRTTVDEHTDNNLVDKNDMNIRLTQAMVRRYWQSARSASDLRVSAVSNKAT